MDLYSEITIFHLLVNFSSVLGWWVPTWASHALAFPQCNSFWLACPFSAVLSVQVCSRLALDKLKVKVAVISDSLWLHGILQVRVLEWVAFPLSRGSFQPRDRTQVSQIAGRFFISWATREVCLWNWTQKLKYSFQTDLCVCWSLSCVGLCDLMGQAPLSTGFSRQEYSSGLACPSPGDLHCRQILYQLSHQEAPQNCSINWIFSQKFQEAIRNNLYDICHCKKVNSFWQMPVLTPSLPPAS